MTHTALAIPILLLTFTTTQAAAPELRAPASAKAMTQAARDFLAALTPAQRDKASFPFDTGERMNWHYFPKSREGIALSELDPKQAKLAQALLSSALSAQGHGKVSNIVLLEGILGERSRMYDAGAYHLSVFGEPAGKTPWGWRFEGHHLSLNFTLVKGEFIATSPSFFGANPAQVREGPRKGLRALAGEEDLARQLIQSLDDKQRQVAIVDTRSYAQIASGTDEKVKPPAAEGISAAQLTASQRDLLLKLLNEYAATLQPDLAQLRMAQVRAASPEALRFAWSGGTKPGEAHYYRVQAPTFLLEYDNSQNSANHIHCVWRDFNGDFGRDLLQEHVTRYHRGSMASAHHH